MTSLQHPQAAQHATGGELESVEGEHRSGRGSGGIARFLVRRVAAGLLTLIVASVVIFAGTNILPGNVAEAVLGRRASPQALASLEAQLGLDDPLWMRYWNWLTGLLHGDLGDSAAAIVGGSTDPAIWPLISEPLLNTLFLALLTMVVLVPLTLVIGVVTARRAGSVSDNATSAVTIVLMAVPEFVIASLLIYVVFTKLGLLSPVVVLGPGEKPWTAGSALILPVCTLIAVTAAWTTRLIRASMIDELESDYVLMARLSGWPERTIVWRVALRNALAPSIQAYALTAMSLLGGVAVVEAVFNYPGIGQKLVNAASLRDLTLVQSLGMLIATAYVILNIAADVLVIFVVPKLRTEML